MPFLETTLSVVIPNYNHGELLKKLLPSLLSQSRPPDEIVIVDDGSIDDSVATIQELAKKDDRIKLFQNKQNRGVIYSLNRALDEVKSTYVTFPSADNWVMPGMYEESLKLLQKHPEAGLCCSDPFYYCEKTKKTTLNKLDLSTSPSYFSPGEVEKLCMQKHFCPGNISHTIVAKLEAMKTFKKGNECFHSDLKWQTDFFLWNAVALRYGICYLPKGFGVFRVAETSYSGKLSSWDERKSVYSNMLSYLEKPEFKDVKQKFQRGGIFIQFTYSMLGFLILRPKYYGYFRKTYLKTVPWSAYIYARSIAIKIPFLRKVYRAIKKAIVKRNS